nr:RHS repeat-associated core domain-containing protein [Kineococcus siccus]
MLACSLRSAAPTVSNCSGSSVPLSWDASTGTQERAILRFESLADAVPADAIIADAQLQLNIASPAAGTTAPTGAAASVDVRELTKYYEPGASWNQATNTTAWATPGGDRAALVSARTQVVANGTYQNIGVSELVQRWVEGTSTAHGFVLEKTSATAGGARVVVGAPSAGATTAPKLQVIWEPRVGDRKGNSALLTEELDDRTTVTVNPATGNAAVETSALAIAGVGLDLNVTQTSNSLSTNFRTATGYGWNSSIGDQHLQRYGKTTFYRDGAGTNWTFYLAVDGTWVRPLGLDVDLVQNANNTFTMTDRRAKVVTSFVDIGSPAGEWYKPATITDRNGNAITFAYDATARTPYNGWKILRSVTDTRGRVLTVANGGAYNAFMEDVQGRSVYYTITNDNLTTFSNGAGGDTTYTYDAARRVTSITVPEGQRTELTYDRGGRVLTLKRITADVGTKTWTFAYTPFTRTAGVSSTKTTVTDSNNHNTVYTSDGRGRVMDATDARGKKRSGTYTPNDDGATATGATAGAGGAGQTTVDTYDSVGSSPQAATWNLSSSRLPSGAGISNTYGTGTRLYDVMTSTDARGNVTTNTYDTVGNPTSSTTGGLTTKNLYQGNTDPDYGGTVNCGPTVNNVITATKAGVLCETRDGAYVKGATAASTTAHRVAYRYNAKGELVTLLPGTPSAQQQQTFAYDTLSRLTSTTDGRGQATTYSYDAMDRVISTRYADGRVVNTFYGAPGGNGWLKAVEEFPSATATTPDRATDYVRDGLGRLKRTEAPEDVISLGYDLGGNLTSYTDNGGAVSYGYNDADQLTSLALPGGTCTGQSITNPGAASTKCVLFAVDDDGRRTNTRYPGGQSMATTLDDSGRLKQVIGTTLAGTTSTPRLNLAYTYTDTAAPTSATNPTKDTALVSSVTDALSAAKTTYSHDGLDRLTAASTAPTAGGAVTRYEGFCYDGAGNRTAYLNTTATTCTSGTPAASFTYNGGNELTTATGVTPTGAPLTGTGYTYDGNGNQTSSKSAPGLSTTYNAQEAAASFTPAGGTAIAQAYAAGNGGNGERIRSGTGATATSFAVSPLSPAPAWSKTGTTSTWTVRDPSGTLIAVRIGSSPTTTTEYYPFTDNVASVRAMVKADGTLANTYSYSAYGSTLNATEAAGASQPFRYGGGHTDAATGLVKLGIRYYDPTQGRFTQQDPTSQDRYAYAYAFGSPTSHADPTGAIPPLLIAAGVAAVRAAAPHVARAAAPYVRQVVRVGGGRVSLGPARNHWKRMSPGMQSVARYHVHVEKRYGGIDNWVRGTNRTWWKNG